MSLRTYVLRQFRKPAYWIAGRLGPPRDEAFRALLRSLRDLAEGREPVGSTKPPSVPPDGQLNLPKLAPVAPLPVDLKWSTPPLTQTGEVVRSLQAIKSSPPRYDVELLDQLNSEYESRPLVPFPPLTDPGARHQAALRRIRGVHRQIGLRNKSVLEIGCGEGFEVWTLGTDLGCEAYGIDVRERGTWEQLKGAHVHYLCEDLAVHNPFPSNEFDRVISFAVWEHVLHPYAMLRETFKVLKPGGLAHIRANLYAGPMASHRYRDIYFPWPHLLFSDDVIKEWDVKHGRRPLGSSWVNRLAWDQYARHIAHLGFRLRKLTFQETQWDEEFYQRFEDVLGRFPRKDLSRDFFTATLEKPQ